MFKVNNKDTCSSISIVDFKQVNAGWVYSQNQPYLDPGLSHKIRQLNLFHRGKLKMLYNRPFKFLSFKYIYFLQK